MYVLFGVSYLVFDCNQTTMLQSEKSVGKNFNYCDCELRSCTLKNSPIKDLTQG